jgi:hypothetical protein
VILLSEVAKRWPVLAAALVAALLSAAVVADSASAWRSINLQTATQRSRGDTYWRCSVYPRIESGAPLGQCIHWWAGNCKYRILSGRRVRCDTHFTTVFLPTGTQTECYQRLTWKGHDNNIRIVNRSRQDCIDPNRG